MADIKIINLSGSNLFDDAESFMSEINDESVDVIGGAAITCRDITKIACEYKSCGFATKFGCAPETFGGCTPSVRPE
jgi:hypothetical protein